MFITVLFVYTPAHTRKHVNLYIMGILCVFVVTRSEVNIYMKTSAVDAL